MRPRPAGGAVPSPRPHHADEAADSIVAALQVIGPVAASGPSIPWHPVLPWSAGVIGPESGRGHRPEQPPAPVLLQELAAPAGQSILRLSTRRRRRRLVARSRVWTHG